MPKKINKDDCPAVRKVFKQITKVLDDLLDDIMDTTIKP